MEKVKPEIGMRGRVMIRVWQESGERLEKTKVRK